MSDEFRESKQQTVFCLKTELFFPHKQAHVPRSAIGSKVNFFSPSFHNFHRPLPPQPNLPCKSGPCSHQYNNINNSSPTFFSWSGKIFFIRFVCPLRKNIAEAKKEKKRKKKDGWKIVPTESSNGITVGENAAGCDVEQFYSSRCAFERLISGAAAVESCRRLKAAC